MDDSNAIRAITIGAGLFISITTISLILTYYNVAKSTAQSIGTGTNISQNYDRHIRDILTKANIKGSDVINICNYFEEEITGKAAANKIKFSYSYKGKEETKVSNVVSSVLPNENFILTVTYDGDGNITEINIKNSNQ
mgnify:CR=1 FL=1